MAPRTPDVPTQAVPGTLTGLTPAQSRLGRAAIVYDSPRRRAPAPQLQARDLEIIRALWRYDFLTTSQIGEEWWRGCHPSRAQIRLAELFAGGLLARFRPLVERGTHQWIYQLARQGFRAGQRCYGPEGEYIDQDSRWSERRIVDMRPVLQGLRVNAWMLAYRRLAPSRIADWLGPREARVIAPSESSGAGDEPPATISPDAAALLEIDPDSPPVELLVEFERDERPIRHLERLRRYDSLLASSWSSVPRLRGAGGPPAVAFVTGGYQDVDRLVRLADGEVGAQLGALRAPSRERFLFCAEADLHRGDLRAWMLPSDPPSIRGEQALAAREVRLPS